MAIVPSNTRFVGISSSVDLVEKKSALVNKDAHAYTIEDIAQSVGGGGGLGSLKIETDGQLGNPLTMNVTPVIPVTDVVPGLNTYEAIGSISVQLSGGGGYGGGGAFTATTVAFPELTYAYSVNIGSTTTLETISFPDLERLASSMYLSQNTALDTLDFPELISCSTIDISYMPNLTNLNFPSLVTIGNFGSNGDAGAFSYINGTQFPAIRTAGFGGQGIYSINLPALTTVTGFNFYSNGIQTISLSGLENFKQNYFSFDNKTTLTSFMVGAAGTTKTWGAVNNGPSGQYSNPFISFQNCSLNQASVDNILVVLASLNGTNGTTEAVGGVLYLNSGSNASPSQVGLDAKAVLLNRGWQVANN